MRRGIGLALISAALFGASTPLAKALLGTVDPWMLAGLLYLGAGLGLGLLRLLRGPGGEAAMTRADRPWLALVVLFGGVVGPVCLMLGLVRTDAATAALMLNLESVATLALAWIVFRENVDRRLLLGAAAIVAGSVVLSWQGAARLDPGAAWIALACLAWGIDNNLTRRLSASDPVQIALIKGLAAGSVNLTLALALGAALPGAGTVALAGLVGFLGYGLSLVCFVLALRHLGAARTGAWFAAAPFVGAGLAVAAFGAPVTPTLLAGAALMAFGLWLHLTEAHDHTHHHAEMEHDHRHVHDAHHRHAHPPGTDPGEPHSHKHRHEALTHRHPHYPDLHHRHDH